MAIIAAGSRADVDRLGAGFRAESRSTADSLARYEQANEWMRAIEEKGLQAAIRSQGAVLGQGAAPGALSPDSRGEGARVDELADGDGDEGSMGGQQRQVTAQGGRFGGANGAGGCTPWLEL